MKEFKAPVMEVITFLEDVATGVIAASGITCYEVAYCSRVGCAGVCNPNCANVDGWLPYEE